MLCLLPSLQPHLLTLNFQSYSLSPAPNTYFIIAPLPETHSLYCYLTAPGSIIRELSVHILWKLFLDVPYSGSSAFSRCSHSTLYLSLPKHLPPCTEMAICLVYLSTGLKLFESATKLYHLYIPWEQHIASTQYMLGE